MVKPFSAFFIGREFILQGKGSTFTVTIPLEKIRDEEISSDNTNLF